jgi:hypothetical protein
MRGASLSVLVVVALAGLLPSAVARADDEETSTDEAPAEAPTKIKRPQSAGAALLRAAAAYEYGDINQVVDSARLITEGVLPSAPAQQTQALRFLGIGLYLTNRPGGAEAAFTELLRQEPEAHLDPTSTRPEVVAFFENLRRQQRLQQRSPRRLTWNFIPPVGQFQNDDHVKGWLVLTVGVASLATTITTDVVLRRWHEPGDTYKGHEKTGSADTLKAVNYIAAGVLAATYIYGVFDGLIGYSKPLEDPKPSFSLRFTSDGGLGFTF